MAEFATVAECRAYYAKKRRELRLRYQGARDRLDAEEREDVESTRAAKSAASREARRRRDKERYQKLKAKRDAAA